MRKSIGKKMRYSRVQKRNSSNESCQILFQSQLSILTDKIFMAYHEWMGYVHCYNFIYTRSPAYLFQYVTSIRFYHFHIHNKFILGKSSPKFSILFRIIDYHIQYCRFIFFSFNTVDCIQVFFNRFKRCNKKLFPWIRNYASKE